MKLKLELRLPYRYAVEQLVFRIDFLPASAYNNVEAGMYETMAIDPRTIIVKTDSEEELSEIIDFVTMRDKERNL
ncbi:MAG: hypothetical protein FWB78_12300, partial [Treponema sp.]|nr:hypothetical protein [Treponema sp.]